MSEVSCMLKWYAGNVIRQGKESVGKIVLVGQALRFVAANTIYGRRFTVLWRPNSPGTRHNNVLIPNGTIATVGERYEESARSQ